MAATIRIVVSTSGSVKQISDDLDGLGKTSKETAKGFDALKEAGVGALRRVGEIATNAAAAAAAAFGDFIKGSVKVAGDFESGMNQFSAVVGDSLGDSGKSLNDFKDLFIQLGRDLPVSTAEVQQAAIELAKGGIDPATIAAGGLRTALDLAAAGGVGLAESATIMSKQLGVWVDQAADAKTKSDFLAQSADLIAQAANASTVDVHELALGLANAGGMAKASGLTFRDTVTTMALVSSGFSSAADAGTSFKTFLGRLQPTTDSAASAMRDLNLLTSEGKSKFFDATGAFVGMEHAADMLKGALDGTSAAQKSAALQAIFGADAFRMGAILADKGAEGYRAMAEAMLKAGGVSQQAAARQQGFNTAMDNMGGSLEALQITLGTATLPMITKLVNLLASGVNAITSYADATMRGETALAKIAGTISDLFMPAVAGATTALIAFAAVNSSQIAISLALLSQRIPLITAEMWGMAGATAAAAAPFVVLAAAVGGALLIWNKLNSTVKSATTQLLETREWWVSAGDAVMRFGNQTGESKKQLEPYAATITAIREQIQGEVEDLGKRMAAGMVSDAQYQTEMATINQHRQGLAQATDAYNAQEQAIIATQTASMTATEASKGLTSATAELGNQASLTEKDIEDLGKKIQETYKNGEEALQGYANNQSTFLQGVEVRQLDHAAKITELEAQKAAATTAEQKKGFDAQIAQEQDTYHQQEQTAAASYAAQQAAQLQHLGQMLIDYTVAQASLGNIAKDKAAEITNALEVQYGLQESSQATTFLKMAGTIDQYAKDSGKSVSTLVDDLKGQQQQAADTQKAMDDYATVYTAEQVNNFLEGKADAREYTNTLESIPREIHTTVFTDKVVKTYEQHAARDDVQARASGGPITAGRPYLVGENGPELIIPTSDGHVMNNQATTNITNNLNFAPNYSSGSSTKMDYSFAKSLAGVV